MDNIDLGGATKRELESRKTRRRPLSGTPSQPSKGTRLGNIISLKDATNTGSELRKTRRRLLNGAPSQQSRVMLMVKSI